MTSPPAIDSSSLSLADAAFQLNESAKRVTKLTQYRSPTTHHIVADPAQVIDPALLFAVRKTPGSSSDASNPSPVDNEDPDRHQVLRDFSENDLRNTKGGRVSIDLEKIVQSYKAAIQANAHQIAHLTTALDAESAKVKNLSVEVGQKQVVEREIARKSMELKVLEVELLESQRETESTLRETEEIKRSKSMLEVRETELAQEVHALEATLECLAQTQSNAEDRIQELQYLSEHYEDSQQGTIEKEAQLQVSITTELGLCKELQKELEKKNEKSKELNVFHTELEDRIKSVEQSYDQEMDTSMFEDEEYLVKLREEIEGVGQEIERVEESDRRKLEETIKIRAAADQAKEVFDTWKVSHPCSTPEFRFPILPSILAFSLGLFFSLFPVIFSLRLEVN